MKDTKTSTELYGKIQTVIDELDSNFFWIAILRRK